MKNKIKRRVKLSRKKKIKKEISSSLELGITHWDLKLSCSSSTENNQDFWTSSHAAPWASTVKRLQGVLSTSVLMKMFLGQHSTSW